MIEPIRRQGKYNYASCLKCKNVTADWVKRVEWYMSGRYLKPLATVEIARILSTAREFSNPGTVLHEILVGPCQAILNTKKGG